MRTTDSGGVAGDSPPREPTNTLSYDPEYLEVLKSSSLAGADPPNLTTVQEMRAFTDSVMAEAIRKVAAAVPLPSDAVTETKFEIQTFDGATITITRFAQQHHHHQHATGAPLRPAVYHIHGGGLIAGRVEHFAPAHKHSVVSWDVQIFAIGYRVAPENPAPGPVEDAFAGLKWLSENGPSLGVDPGRIILYGESAGGGIGAGTALMARDRGLSPPLAKQVLIYPMLDDRTEYGPGWRVRSLLTWTERDNALGWSSYLGADKRGREDADVSVYAVPGRAEVEDLVGLPRTYMDVGSLDLFCGEDLRYATRLLEAGVEVEFHVYPGVPHGFESSIKPSVVGRAMENRKRAVLAV